MEDEDFDDYDSIKHEDEDDEVKPDFMDPIQMLKVEVDSEKTKKEAKNLVIVSKNVKNVNFVKGISKTWTVILANNNLEMVLMVKIMTRKMILNLLIFPNLWMNTYANPRNR